VFLACLPMIERALSHGAGDCITVGGLYRKCADGELSMWVVHEGDDIIACLILSVHQFEAKRTLFVEILAGRGMDDWIGNVEPLLADCAALLGADTIEASCRLGLARRLVKRGTWKQKAVLMEMRYER
jgi:hypothetical protein